MKGSKVLEYYDLYNTSSKISLCAQSHYYPIISSQIRSHNI